MSQPNLSMSKPGSQEGKKKTSYIKYEVEPGFTVRLRQNFNPHMDPKMIKHLISNRVAVQKSRWKKVQYADDLLKRSQKLEMEVSMLRSLVGKASEQKQCLEIEQKQLEERASAWRQHFVYIQGEIEANQLEIERMQKMIQHN